jgi:glucokinase
MPEAPQRNTSSTRVPLGVEIAEGGMRLVVARASERRWRRQLTAPPSPDEALATLNTLIGQALNEGADSVAQPAAMGVALWDDVDPARGVVRGMRHASTSSEWGNFPLAARLSEHWRAPVRLCQAAAAAGLAEAMTGAGQGYHVALYLHSGRTISSALITDGALTSDATGRSGMLGHWLVGLDGPRCACGQRGHLDPLASAQSIVRATIGRASGSDASTAAMLRVSGGRAEAMTVRQVTQLASEGDPAARAVLETASDALAVALANLVAALDPDVIILGGAPSEAGEAFCAPLRERLTSLCIPWRPVPDLVAGQMEARAAALTGAALLAQRLSATGER